MAERSHPAFLKVGLAGAWVIRGLEREAVESLLRTVGAQYHGGDFGGFDFMPPNDAGEAWLFVGSWTDCMDPAVATSIAEVDRCMQSAAELVKNGVLPRGGSSVEVRIAPSTAAASVTAYEYAVGIVPVPVWTWSPLEYQRHQHVVFPSVPGWIGVHMGMPHWLGRGMHRDGAAIRSFTPYARITTVPERGIEIAAMAEPHALDAWLAALRSASGWW